jgi:hypothetical protein
MLTLSGSTTDTLPLPSPGLPFIIPTAVPALKKEVFLGGDAKFSFDIVHIERVYLVKTHMSTVAGSQYGSKKLSSPAISS